MSIQKTLTADPANIITVNASKFFGKSLNEIYKIYNVPKEETYIIGSLFFKKLYKLRKEKEVLHSDSIRIRFEVFKKILQSYCLEITEYLSNKIKHQKVLNIFLKQLNHLSLKKDDLILINDLAFFYGKNTMKMLSQCSPIIAKSNDVNKYAIKTLKMLVYRSNKEHLPLELTLILLFDAQIIYYVYHRLFNEGTRAYKTYMLESALLMQLAETPFATIIYNDREIFYRNNPPEANDIDFINAVNNKGNTFSLPYIVDYFGHHAWYDSFFPNQEVNEDNLFRFSLENFF